MSSKRQPVVRLWTVGVLLVAVAANVSSQSAPQGSAAMPLKAIDAILDAFREYRVVGLGDAHGNRLGEAFQQSLIRDARLPTIVNDIVIEAGNSRYQELADRYIRGENVPPETLRRIWLDTTQQHAASLEIPAIFAAVRDVNTSLRPERRIRVLLGEPPIDWDRIRTRDDMRAWDASPGSSRDGFAADLIRREVVAKNRRALLLYGAGHFFRRVVNESIVTLLEPQTPVFTVWTNAGTELAAVQPDVAAWPVPSLTKIRGTVLGSTGLAMYLGPNAGDVPKEWLAPMQDQFDAVMYLGPQASITFDRPKPWRCAEPALPERLRRLDLQRPGMAARVKEGCTQD